MQNEQEPTRVPSPKFSVADVLRHRLSVAESRGDTVPLHFFRFYIPPGVDCESELSRIADEFNRAVSMAARAASHDNTAKTHEQIREKYINLVKPILRDYIQKTEDIESRRI
jgi:peroxiredoxin